MVCTCLRNSHEMVVFKVQLLLLMMIKVSGAQTVSLQLCSPPKKGDPCQMSCTTPDHTEDITFASNGNPRGTCPIILGNPACGANTAQPSATVTTFIIASLSRSTDDGTWTCTYGSAPGITDTQTLTVLTYPSTPSSSNITHTNGMTTSLRVSSEQIIDLTLVMDCTYPPPTVTWNFKECSGGSTLASKTGSVSEDTSASNICGSTEKNYISTTTFSSSDISNSDGQCVRPELEIKVGNFTAYTVEADFTMTVPESGLGPGAIAGIIIAVCVVVIAVVVILVILWKKKLLCFKGNKLGDLVWAKLERYPWWPGLVCNHRTELTHQTSGENPQIDVQFFDDPQSRAWIKAKNVKEFKGSDHANFKEGGLFFSLSKDIQKGAKRADDALKLTEEERLKLVINVQNYDDKNEEEFHGYKLGDLVWAKLEGYPWWPSLVCNRPTELTHQKSRENPQIHIQFFDDRQSRAWIKAKNVKEFRGSDHADFKEGGLFFSLNEDVQKGAKEADDALKLTEEGRLKLVEGYKKGDLVWAKLEGYPWWPSLVCNCATELTHQKSPENPQIHVQFFDNQQSRAWIKAKDVKEFRGSDHADFKKGGLFFSPNKDVQKGAKKADDALKLTKERQLRKDKEFDDATEKTMKTTKDKKIDRLSVVNEKAQKPQTPGHLTADTVARPQPGRPLPPKPVKKKKKKGSKKKRKKTKNEDGGEDSVKVPSIEKKEKNMEHYTENKKEYES